MNFDFNSVSVESGKQYLQPGNHLVKTSEVKNGVSSQKGTPYVEVTVTDKSGATCSNQYYLSTEVGEGKQKSAFDISGPAIVRLVAATNNLDANTEEGKNKAKALLGNITSPESLATKLSTLMVGKEFGLHLDGKWVNPTDTTKQSWIKAEFGGGSNFAVPASKFGTLTTNVKVKGEKAPTAGGQAILAEKTDW